MEIKECFRAVKLGAQERQEDWAFRTWMCLELDVKLALSFPLFVEDFFSSYPTLFRVSSEGCTWPWSVMLMGPSPLFRPTTATSLMDNAPLPYPCSVESKARISGSGTQQFHTHTNKWAGNRDTPPTASYPQPRPRASRTLCPTRSHFLPALSLQAPKNHSKRSQLPSCTVNQLGQQWQNNSSSSLYPAPPLLKECSWKMTHRPFLFWSYLTSTQKSKPKDQTSIFNFFFLSLKFCFLNIFNFPQKTLFSY